MKYLLSFLLSIHYIFVAQAQVEVDTANQNFKDNLEHQNKTNKASELITSCRKAVRKLLIVTNSIKKLLKNKS